MAPNINDSVIDDGHDENEIFTAPWSITNKQRRSHLEGLSGSRLKRDLDGLNQAAHIFGINNKVLARHIAEFINSESFANSLGDSYSLELVRHLHNFLASVTTLIDQQRVVIRRCWPEKEDASRKAFEDLYGEQLSLIFDAEEAQFIKGLRNYCVHYSIPNPKVRTRVSGQDGILIEHENTLGLDRDTLLQWNKWPGKGRGYLNKQNAEFDLAPIIQRYLIDASGFYEWFWEAILEANRDDVEEAQRKGQEFGLWYEEVLAPPEWIEAGVYEAPLGWSYRRMRANRRITRFKFGSYGYVTRQVNQNGEIEWVSDPWRPLPVRGWENLPDS